MFKSSKSSLIYISLLGYIRCWEKPVKISNCNCRIVCFSLKFCSNHCHVHRQRFCPRRVSVCRPEEIGDRGLRAVCTVFSTVSPSPDVPQGPCIAFVCICLPRFFHDFIIFLYSWYNSLNQSPQLGTWVASSFCYFKSYSSAWPLCTRRNVSGRCIQDCNCWAEGACILCFRCWLPFKKVELLYILTNDLEVSAFLHTFTKLVYYQGFSLLPMQ